MKTHMSKKWNVNKLKNPETVDNFSKKKKKLQLQPPMIQQIVTNEAVNTEGK